MWSAGRLAVSVPGPKSTIRKTEPAGGGPPVEVPAIDELRRAVAVPDVPEDFPAVARLLDQLAGQPLDPWALTFPPS